MNQSKEKFCSKSCPEQTAGVDYVREEYKRYKKKDPPPDLSSVIQFGDEATYKNRVDKLQVQNILCQSCWLQCTSKWRVYGLKSSPGFYFITNPFKPGAERYWIERCVRDFPRKPNVSNLDAHVELGSADSVWEMSQSNSTSPDLINKLSWVHLGYKFDYNCVDYVPEKYYGFPEDLAALTRHIALAVGYPGYHPETGIINYYGLGRSMGGHTDHYEEDWSSPLVSLSFGQSAIFLIGGKTRDVRPTALFVHSGDVIILSGESRLAFHAVPKIIRVTHSAQDGKKTFLTLFDREILPCDFHPNEETSLRDSSEIPPNKLRDEERKTKTKMTADEHANDVSKEGTECALLEPEGEKNAAYKNSAAFLESSLYECELEYLSEYISRTRININVRQVHSTREDSEKT